MLDKTRQILNVILALAQPTIGFLTNTGVTGPDLGTVSNRYPTYVVPAGYAFSIWSVIFLLTIGYAVYQALPAHRTNSLLREIGWLTASTMAATSTWMLIFQRSYFALSLVVIFWLLLSLIGVIALLYRWMPRTGNTLSRAATILVYGTFSIFLGWVSVATVANIAQVLTANNWSGAGLRLELWGVIALALVGFVACFLTKALEGNAPFALTIMWAVIAVAVNQFTQAVPTNSPLVGTVAVIVVALIGVTLLISRGNYTRKQLIGSYGH